MPSLPSHFRYQLQQRIATTIFGEVRFALDCVTGDQVAIKLSNLHLISQSMWSGDVPENPIEEVRLMKLFQHCPHNNVLQLLDEFDHEGWHWMVLEYASGGELLDHVLDKVQTNSIDMEQSLKWFEQIAKGLSHVHARGIAHLDISLENCLVNSHGTIKLCDFGLAQECMVPVKKAKGKAFYMAPEVANPRSQKGDTDNEYDPRQADMFSLGVVLFMLTVGFQPFEIPHRRDPRFAYLLDNGACALLKKFGVEVPDQVGALLEKMLVVHKGRATIGEILEKLELQRKELDNMKEELEAPAVSA